MKRMERILIACDSFKGSLTSQQVGDACLEGIKRVLPDVSVEILAMADGGEGTAEALTEAMGGYYVGCDAVDPLMRPLTATYGIAGDTAIIDIATASGLTLLKPEERNPLLANTYGTGLLIVDAMARGSRRLILGLGGSATVDGGIGILAALGVRFLDADGYALDCVPRVLQRMHSLDASGMPERIKECEIIVLSDVENLLCGPQGAAAVFGPQKGADAEAVRILDEGLRRYAEILRRHCGKDVGRMKCSGAAGGVLASLAAFFPKLTVSNGADALLDIMEFERRLEGVDMVITGEGKMDSQTLCEKLPIRVMERCRQRGVRVVAIGGMVDEGIDWKGMGFYDVVAAKPVGMSLLEAMQEGVARKNISFAATKICQVEKNG